MEIDLVALWGGIYLRFPSATLNWFGNLYIFFFKKAGIAIEYEMETSAL